MELTYSTYFCPKLSVDPLVSASLSMLPPVSVHQLQEAYTTITEVLSAFTELRSLELPCQRGFHSMLNATRENGAAKTWNERAQHLSSITFPSGHVWRRQANGTWAPASR